MSNKKLLKALVVAVFILLLIGSPAIADCSGSIVH